MYMSKTESKKGNCVCVLDTEQDYVHDDVVGGAEIEERLGS